MFEGNILKQLRIEKGLNQLELAEVLGSTQKNISNYETNKARPDFEVLINMSKFFNVSTDYLLGQNSTNLNNLSENEMYIIDTYRSLRPETKVDFLSTVKMIKTLREIQKKNMG